VLADLAEAFPLVAALVERHAGGQKRLPMGGPGAPASGSFVPAHLTEASNSSRFATGRRSDESAEPSPIRGDAGPTSTDREDDVPEDGPRPRAAADDEAPEGRGAAEIPWPAGRGRRRPTRLGLTLQFESRPDDPELGRLVESTVWVNDAHPA